MHSFHPHLFKIPYGEYLPSHHMPDLRAPTRAYACRRARTRTVAWVCDGAAVIIAFLGTEQRSKLLRPSSPCRATVAQMKEARGGTQMMVSARTARSCALYSGGHRELITA